MSFIKTTTSESVQAIPTEGIRKCGHKFLLAATCPECSAYLAALHDK